MKRIEIKKYIEKLNCIKEFCDHISQTPFLISSLPALLPHSTVCVQTLRLFVLFSTSIFPPLFLFSSPPPPCLLTTHYGNSQVCELRTICPPPLQLVQTFFFLFLISVRLGNKVLICGNVTAAPGQQSVQLKLDTSCFYCFYCLVI